MLEERVDGNLVAVDDVEDAVGKTRLLEQLGREEGRRRILLRRLEHERVAARERRRPHPHRDHRREVERRDPRDHTERLADRVDVDAARHLFAHPALQKMRHAAAELDHLEPARDLPRRVRKNLAVLAREVLCDLLTPRMEELTNREEELGPLRERQRPPRGQCLPRGLDRQVDLLHRREIDRARLLTRRRVEHRPCAARPTRVGRSRDPVVDRLDGAGCVDDVGHFGSLLA